MNKNYLLKFEMNMSAGDTAELLVYGSIVQGKYCDEDITAKEFDTLIKDAKSKGATKLNLRINSPGGIVYQAVAMRQMLINSGLDVSVSIEGLCASAATLLCCVPGAPVSIAQGSFFMIHNPWVFAAGNARELRKEADNLEKLETSVRDIYKLRCGKDDEEIKNLMDEETWLTAEEAVKEGFCDSVADACEAAAYVNPEDYETMRLMYAHTPDLAEKVAEKVSNAPHADAGEAAEINEEVPDMEIKDITMEQLKEGNSAVYDAIIAAGAAAERDRMNEIDDLTPAGYEEMAATAKQNGTSPMDFCKMIVKAQKQKGADYMTARTTETAPAAQVKGESAEPNETDEYAAFAREAKELAAAQMKSEGGMY